MRKTVAVFLVFSIISLNTGLYAKERRGADLVVQKKDGQQVNGELIAVKKDSLLLMENVSGVLIVSAVAINEEYWGADYNALAMGAIGLAGALIGGFLLGSDKTFYIHKSMDDSAINKILEDLRKKARVSDFQ